MTKRIQLNHHKPLFWFDRPGEMTIKVLTTILSGENDLISLNQSDTRNLALNSNCIAVSYGYSNSINEAVREAINTMQKRFSFDEADNAIMQIVFPKETTLDALSFEEELNPLKSIPIVYGLKVKENTPQRVVLMVSNPTKVTNYVKNQEGIENF